MARPHVADTSTVESLAISVRVREWRQVVSALAVVLLGAYAVYVAAVDLDAIPLGDYQYDEAPGQGVASVASLLGWLLALVASLASLRSPTRISLVTRVLLPVVLALGFVAGYYTYDSYCAPEHCRVSDLADVSIWVVIVPVLFALTTAALAGIRPRTSMAMTVICLVGLECVSLYIGPWH